MKSIRRRLLLWLLGTVLVGSVAAAWSTFFKARAEANQLFDYHLKQIALSLRDQTFAPQQVLGTLEEEIDYDFVIQVWSKDGVRRYLSHPHKALPPRADPGYARVITEEGAWRTFGLQSGELTIQVAQPFDVRRDLAARLAFRTILPFLILLPIFGLAVWVTIGQGLRPLERLTAAVGERSPSSLQPLPDDKLPREVKPLVDSLNGLLYRLDRAIAAQRDFIADAAHELRTPLAALQLQAQLAERAQSADERARAFAELKQGLKRAAHVVQQLLTLARQEPGVVEPSLVEPVDLSKLAKQVVAEHALVAADKGVDLGMGRDDAATVPGDAESLRIMLANLVDNAIRYTPRDGRIDVSATALRGAPVLEVTDSGPGIPEADRGRVFDRFYRRAGSGAGGNGLGLAIVKNIAERHGASVALGSGPRGQGLSVRVTFRAARSPGSPEQPRERTPLEAT